MRKTCEDCIHNEDLLCDAKGILIEDDDDACRLWDGTRGDSDKYGKLVKDNDKKVDDNISIFHFSS